MAERAGPFQKKAHLRREGGRSGERRLATGQANQERPDLGKQIQMSGIAGRTLLKGGMLMAAKEQGGCGCGCLPIVEKKGAEASHPERNKDQEDKPTK